LTALLFAYSLLPLSFPLFPTKPFADMYTKAFEKLYLANKIRRDSALRVLKMWHFLSCLAGADTTLGLADHIRQRFDITLLEMEDSSSLVHSPPPHVR
jgi:hypothetical protein